MCNGSASATPMSKTVVNREFVALLEKVSRLAADRAALMEALKAISDADWEVTFAEDALHGILALTRRGSAIDAACALLARMEADK